MSDQPRLDRLRANADRVVGLLVQEDMRWAADEIVRLQAEIVDLRDARDGQSVYEMRLEDQVKDMQAVVDAARKESGRHLPFRYVGGGTAPCDCGLCDAIRTYDGEVSHE